MLFRSAVSLRLSPWTTLLIDVEKLIESAPNRLAAISNDERVRVDGSKKAFITVRPCKAFLSLAGLSNVFRNWREFPIGQNSRSFVVKGSFIFEYSTGDQRWHAARNVSGSLSMTRLA